MKKERPRRAFFDIKIEPVEIDPNAQTFVTMTPIKAKAKKIIIEDLDSNSITTNG